MRLVVLVSDLPLMLLAGLGLRRAAGCGWPASVLAAGGLFYALAHGVREFDSLSEPALLGLIVLAAGYLAEFGRVWSNAAKTHHMLRKMAGFRLPYRTLPVSFTDFRPPVETESLPLSPSA